MSDDERAFLAGISEHPNEAVRRMAYADWLEEHADPRGEYVRLGQQLLDIASRLTDLRKELPTLWVNRLDRPEETVVAVRRCLGGHGPASGWYRSADDWQVGLERFCVAEFEDRTVLAPKAERVARLVAGLPERARDALPGERGFLIRDVPVTPEYDVPKWVFFAAFLAPEAIYKSYEWDAPITFSRLGLVWSGDAIPADLDTLLANEIRTVEWTTHARDAEL